MYCGETSIATVSRGVLALQVYILLNPKYYYKYLSDKFIHQLKVMDTVIKVTFVVP